MRTAIIGAATIAASTAHADLTTVYQGRLHLEADGSYTLEGQVDVDAYRAGFADLLRNYAPWFDRADQIASGITSTDALRIRTGPEDISDLDAIDEFGGVGDDVNFNPLATGGTQDIATGGDFIDKQLNQQRDNFEIASVDVETNVFRQEFGPVQSNRREGIDETFSFDFVALNPWDLSWLTTDAEGFTQEVTISIGTVPAPASSLILGALGIAAARRRR